MCGPAGDNVTESNVRLLDASVVNACLASVVNASLTSVVVNNDDDDDDQDDDDVRPLAISTVTNISNSIRQLLLQEPLTIES